MLVSPDIDLFTIASGDYLRHFAAVLATTPGYRFLLWSANPELFSAVPTWPENVELGMRITTRHDLARLADPQAVSLFPLPSSCFLWLLPLEPLTLPSLVHYTRLLLGGTSGAVGRSSLDRPSCRRLLAEALDTSSAIHLAAGMQQMLC